MGIEFTVETDAPELAAHLEEISSKAMRPEAAKAINRTMTKIRQLVVSDVTMRTGQTKALINRRVKTIKRFRAKPDKLYSVGFLGEYIIPVRKLKPAPRKTSKGVTYKVFPGQSHDPKAFYAVVTLGNGKPGKSAFTRRYERDPNPRKHGLPIQEKYGIIKPFLRRATRRVLRNDSGKIFSDFFHVNMEKRINRDLDRRGLARR